MPTLRKRHSKENSNNNNNNNKNNDDDGRNKNNNSNDNPVAIVTADNNGDDDPVHVEKSCYNSPSSYGSAASASPSAAEGAKNSSSSSSSSFRVAKYDHQDPKKLLSSLPKRIDDCLIRYTSFINRNGVNQDRILKVLQWSSWLISYWIQQRFLVRPYQEAAVGVGGGGDVAVQPQRSCTSCVEPLRKLYLEVSWARYVLRLVGFPTAVEAIRSGSWSAATKDSKNRKLHDLLGQVLAWSMAFYYPLEHAAFLQWRVPNLLSSISSSLFSSSPLSCLPFSVRSDAGTTTITTPRITAAQCSAWSCRFWLLYIVGEVCQSILQLKDLKQEEDLIQQQQQQQQQTSTTTNTQMDIDNSKKDDSEDKQIVQMQEDGFRRRRTHLRLQIIRNALFTFPCINWSLPKWDKDPWLSEPMVNILMWLESVVCIVQNM